MSDTVTTLPIAASTFSLSSVGYIIASTFTDNSSNSRHLLQSFKHLTSERDYVCFILDPSVCSVHHLANTKPQFSFIPFPEFRDISRVITSAPFFQARISGSGGTYDGQNGDL